MVDQERINYEWKGVCRECSCNLSKSSDKSSGIDGGTKSDQQQEKEVQS